MRPTIKKWFRRFGNNIQQIANAIYYCEQKRINFYCPDHPIIHPFSIPFGRDSDISRIFFFKDRFDAFHDQGPGIPEIDIQDLERKTHHIINEFVYPHLKIDLGKEPSLTEDALTIHIRTGDIFINNPHPEYVQNPIDFYLQLIPLFPKTFIVCESPNFIVERLLKEPNTQLHANGFEKDVRFLLLSKNICSSGVGSFTPSLAMISREIQNFYCSSITSLKHLNFTLFDPCKISTYITPINQNDYLKIGDWRIHPSQIEKMKTYKVEKINTTKKFREC